MKISTKIKMRQSLAASLGWLTRCRGRLRILTYHSIADGDDLLLHVRPGLFEDHLRMLVDEGYHSLRVCDLVQADTTFDELPRRVVITFDDGLLNNKTIACPILNKYGFVATFFIPAGAVSEQRRLAHLPEMREYWGYEMLSWDDIRQMADEGFEIGSHSLTHVRVSQQNENVARRETGEAKKILDRELNQPVTSFAYPKGHRDSFSAFTRQLLQQAGYTVGCTQMGGPVRPAADLLELPRNGITGLDDPRSFRRLLAGQYDVLRIIM